MDNKAQLRTIISQYRNLPEFKDKLRGKSDDEALSILVNLGIITLDKNQQISVFRGDSVLGYDGLTLEKEQKNKSKTGSLALVADIPKSDPELLTDERLKSRIKKVTEDLENIEKNNGFLGKLWSGIKNFTGWGAGSNKVRRQVEEDIRLLLEIQKREENLSALFKNLTGEEYSKENYEKFMNGEIKLLSDKEFDGKTNVKDIRQIDEESKQIIELHEDVKRWSLKFKDLTGEEYSEENYEKFMNGEIKLLSEQKLDGYKEGQEMAADTMGDIFSGFAAMGVYSIAVAAIPFTGGLSIVAGTALATAFGGGIKIGIKALDTVGTDRKYESGWHDFITGGFSGALAPFTGGIGGAAGKAVATKLGVQAMKAGAETIAANAAKSGIKQTLKTALINPAGYEYVGGTTFKRIVAMGSEMAADGALGGAIDTTFREGLDNDWDAGAMASGFIQGGIGGLFMAPVVGGGFKLVGKAGHKIGEKVSGKALPDALEKQADNIFTINKNLKELELPEGIKLKAPTPEQILKNQKEYDLFKARCRYDMLDSIYQNQVNHLFAKCISPDGTVNVKTLNEIYDLIDIGWEPDALYLSISNIIRKDGSIQEDVTRQAYNYYRFLQAKTGQSQDIGITLKACMDENEVFIPERLDKLKELVSDKLKGFIHLGVASTSSVNPDGSWNEANYQLIKSWINNPKIDSAYKMGFLLDNVFGYDGKFNPKALDICLDALNKEADEFESIAGKMFSCRGKDLKFNVELYEYTVHLKKTYDYNIPHEFKDLTVEQLKAIEPLIALTAKDSRYNYIPIEYAMTHYSEYDTAILKKMADMAKVEGVDLNIINKYLKNCVIGLEVDDKMWELDLNALDAFPQIIAKFGKDNPNLDSKFAQILRVCRDTNGHFQQANLDMWDRVAAFSEFDKPENIMLVVKDRRGIISPSKLEALKYIYDIEPKCSLNYLQLIMQASEDLNGNLNKSYFNIIKKLVKKDLHGEVHSFYIMRKMCNIRKAHHLSDEEYGKFLLAFDKIKSLNVETGQSEEWSNLLGHFFDKSGHFSQKNVDDHIRAVKMIRKKYKKETNIHDIFNSSFAFGIKGYLSGIFENLSTLRVRADVLNMCFNPKKMEFDFEKLGIITHFMEKKIHPGWGDDILKYLQVDGNISPERLKRLDKVCEFFKNDESWSFGKNTWSGGRMSEICQVLGRFPIREEGLDFIMDNNIPLSAIDAQGVISNIWTKQLELIKHIYFDPEIKIPKEQIVPLIKEIDVDNIEFARWLCTDKKLNFPKDKVALTLEITKGSTITPEILGTKLKKFFDLGFDDEFIKDIVKGAQTFSFYTDDVLKALSNMKRRGMNVQGMLYTINDGVTDNLSKNIERLTTLVQILPEEKLAFKKAGVDINAIMEALSKKIDTKYPTIATTKEGRQAFLKAIANNGNADSVIQHADFEQFGREGIPLQYSREEFMRRMNRIAGSADHGDLSDVNIPKLELTSDDAAKTEIKIIELRGTKKHETVEIIIDGKTEKAVHFLDTQGGSNRGYMTQIGDKLYYVKYPDKTKLGQSVEEVMAADLYRIAGIDAPNLKYVYDDAGNIIGMASEYVPDVSMPTDKSSLHDAFAVDAWLANWDAPKNDNSQVRGARAIKMDVGGSLNYRAQGELKPDFGEIVNELTSLIENNGCYSSMKKADILKSLKHVTEIPDEQIWKIIETSPTDDYSLGSKLIARRDFMRKFAQILERTDEAQYESVLDLVNAVKLRTLNEFESNSSVASLLGYVQTKTGFEGLLNTRNLDELNLRPEQRQIAEQMIAEIEKFTKQNRIADGVNLPKEVKDFLNSILQGIPEFAPFFGKPQHAMQKYSLDIHILKVLQDSMNDPLYKQLDDQDKMVLKFATLLHDIGKRYLADGSDTGHAAKSAEYVYSILDRFNLSDDMKDRIISTVDNHHWFKAFNEGVIDEETVATLCRRPQDFLIYRIMAKADLANVNDDFPAQKIKGARNLKHAWELFDEQMDKLELKVNELSQKQVIVTSSKFKDIPERVKPNGAILPARCFPREKAKLGGVETEFRVLNWTKLKADTNMFMYGFNNILLKDIRLLVHMTDEIEGISALNIFRTLAKNPMNYSAQSMSMISLADRATYCGYKFGLILDVDNANISHAFYANTGSGGHKGLRHFVLEMFENGNHRSFVKDQFIEFMQKKKGITLSDQEYGAIAKFLLKKQYPETQLKGKIIKINGKEYKGQDILDAFIFSRGQLNAITKEKTHGSHNELVGLNTKIKGLVAKVDKLEDCPEYILQFAKENDLPIILVGNDGQKSW